MQDPWWHNETWRMANEETEWMVKTWEVYLNDLRTLTKQNEYELRLSTGLIEKLASGRRSPLETAIHEMMMAYIDETKAIPRCIATRRGTFGVTQG